MQTNMIAAFASVSRECDGLERQIAAERAACASRSNVTKLAYLEQMLEQRQAKLDSQVDAAWQMAKTHPDLFFDIVRKQREIELRQAKR